MRSHWIAAWLLTALFLAPLAAGAEEPPGFLIETITVEGTRTAAANIVEAETRLQEGQTYMEEDLRQAIYRVHRLPFVLDATFALRKGSQRGSYELVIQVTPAKWFFFDHSIRVTHFDEPLSLAGREFGSLTTTFSFPGLIGARLFVGRSSVLFGSLDSEEGFQAGYSQYDLFGRGIVASLGYSHLPENVCCVAETLPYALDPGFVSWDWDGYDRTSLNLGIPLRKNQSLQIGWTRKSGGSGERFEVLDTFEFPPVLEVGGSDGTMTYNRAEAKWVLDTSDDPLVPTRGFTLSAGIEAYSFETDDLLRIRYILRELPFQLDVIQEDIPPYEARSVAAVVSATRHWSLTPRQTVSGTGRLSLGRSSIHDLPAREESIQEADLDVYGLSAGLQHAISLRRARGENGFGDLRWETGLEVGFEGSSPQLGLDTPNPLERLSLSTGLVYRNPWGRLRFQLTYLDIGEVLP
ncbi:MAG TPA: hypothetical protein VF756_14600 [Thermoanaerobaculia bacterium]